MTNANPTKVTCSIHPSRLSKVKIVCQGVIECLLSHSRPINLTDGDKVEVEGRHWLAHTITPKPPEGSTLQLELLP